MLTYCLIFKVLTCLFQLLYFIKAVFLCQYFFRSFFWVCVARLPLSQGQVILYHLNNIWSTLFLKSFFSWLPIFRCILVYHLYPGSSITFFKSFCCLFALVSRTSITIPAFIFIVNTFFIYFLKIFYMFLGIIFIHISTILYMSYFQYYK